VLDGHSFPGKPLPYELDQRADRPDVCVGTDGYHTPGWLRDLAVAELEHAGFTIAVDRPFAGALVPMAFHARDERVAAVMIELNRSLYMDEQTGDRARDFIALRERVQGAVARIIDGWSRELSRSPRSS